MKGKYKGRMEETIRQFIAELLMRKVKDPRVANVTIQRVKASDDFSVAKIYYNIIGGIDDLDTVRAGLASSRGFIRNEIKTHIRMRIIPDLVFVYDKSLDEAMRIDEIIDEIHVGEEINGEEKDIG
jgi:ribosome-binding factor A